MSLHKELKSVRDMEPVTLEEAQRMGAVFYGQDAVAKVEAMEGELTPEQKRVVELEGFVSVPYLDTKGNWTVFAGLTKDTVRQGFKGAFETHKAKAKKLIKGFDRLPPWLRTEMIQAAYRGDLQVSRKFRAKFNDADTPEEFKAAAEEFLRNDDYDRSKKDGTGVAGRMEALANAVERYGSTFGDGTVDPTQAPLVDIEGEVRLAIQRQLEQQNVAQTSSELLSGAYTQEEEQIIQMLMSQEDQQQAEDMFDQAIQQEDEYLNQYSQEEEKIIQGLMDGDVVKNEEPEEKTDQDWIRELYWS